MIFQRQAERKQSPLQIRDQDLVGIILGVGLTLALPAPQWGLLIPGVALLIPHNARWLPVGPLLGLILGSASALWWLESRLPDHCYGEEVVVTGRVDTLARKQWTERERWRVSAVLAVTEIAPRRCRGPKRVVLSQYLEQSELGRALDYGEIISTEVRLKPLPSQLNPGVLPDQARSASRGLGAAGTVVAPVAIQREADWLARFRSRVLDDWSGRSGQGWQVLRALLLGDTQAIDRDLWRDLRYLGITHVMVISGLHIGLLAALVSALTQLPRRFFRIPGDRGTTRLSALIVVLTTGLYVLLVGGSLPTQRAYLMLLATQLPLLCGWNTAPSRALLLALVGLVLWDPRVMLGSSFWLSASATWLLVGQSLDSIRLVGLLRVQALLVFLLAPLSLFWFEEASWLGVGVNLLVVPVVTLAMVPLGFAGLALTDLAPEASSWLLQLSASIWEWLVRPLHVLLDCCTEIGVLAASLNLGGLILALATIYWWPNRRRYAVITLSLMTVLHTVPRSIPAGVSVTLLDVGQGLALVVEAAGETLLYDTGDGVPDGFTQAEKTVLPYLRSRGVDVLNTLVISHADRDHSGGAHAIRANLPVKRQLGFGGEACRNGERWRWGELEIVVLNGPGFEAEDSNDQSCGLLLVAGEERILVMGDVSSRREREWVRYWREALSANILVVGHHGSRSSSGHTLLKWVRPTWALISAGRANPFGHPHPEVVYRLTSAWHSAALITSERGAITITIQPSGPSVVRVQRDQWSPYWLKLP